MSVLIRGMEMPTTCRDCRLSTFTNFDSMPFCNITMNDICLNDLETKRCDNCPLVPVPEHGRLIDADVLAEKHRELAYELRGANYDFHITACSWVNSAPTIIPAEEGET